MSSLLAIVRRLATAPGFRRLTTLEPLLRLSFALRASLVRSPLRFALNELRPGRRTGVYELRKGGVRVALRHGTPDVLVLDEIFSQREYEPPPPVQRLLHELDSLKVADVGANIGLFGAFISMRHPATKIVAIEADPSNAAVHERTIAANDRTATWELVVAFAAPAPGTTAFQAGGFALSRVGGDGTEVRAVDVFPYLREADLVKMDIEGAEWPIVADPRFAELRAPIIVLEFHREGCPHGDPAAAAEAALRGAGYRTAVSGSKPAYGAGIVWGWRDET
jgi:FkbM family methyltransferase